MRRLLVPLVLLLFASPLAAQSPSHPCAGESDPSRRLACYDKAFPLSPEVKKAALGRAVDEFGVAKPQNTSVSPGGGVASPDLDRIKGKIVAVEYGAGARRFRLDNGQVWTQTDPRSSGHVRVGESVEVRKAILGGYSLVMPNGISVRVTRTR